MIAQKVPAGYLQNLLDSGTKLSSINSLTHYILYECQSNIVFTPKMESVPTNCNE